MMKKVLSLCIILSLIMSFFVADTILAATSNLNNVLPEGYLLRANKDSIANDRTNRFVLSNNNASDGDYSIFVKNFGVPFSEIFYFTMPIAGAESDTYTFMVDFFGAPESKTGVKFSAYGAGTSLCAYEAKWFYGYNGAIKKSAAEKEGWNTYSWEITGKPEKIEVEIFENTQEIYFDNIRLISKTTQKDIMVNGSFENFANDNTLPDGTLPRYYTLSKGSAGTDELMKNTYTLVNNVSTDGDNSLKIKNIGVPNNHQYYLTPSVEAGAPAGDYVFSMKIFNNPYFSLGTIISVNGSESYNMGDLKWNSTYTDLGNGWYEFKKEFTTTGEIKSIIFGVYEANKEFWVDELSVKNKATGKEYIVNGSFEDVANDNTIKDPTAPYGYALTFGGYANEAAKGDIYTVVNNEYISKSHSLKIKNAGVMSDTQFVLSPQLENNAPLGTYTYSFKIKGQPYAKLGSIHVLKSGTNTLLRADIKYATQSTQNLVIESIGRGWYKYSYTVDCTQSAPTNFEFNIYEAPDVFYFDDFSLTKNGDDSGKNYIINGDFETIDPVAPNEVTSVKVENGNQKAVVTWQNPKDFYYVNVYLNGELYKTLYEKDKPEILVDGLENGTKYDLTFKSFNNYNVASAGLTKKLEPYMPDYETSDITINNTNADVFVSGAYDFKTSLTNNLLNSVSANFIVAVFKNGKLEFAKVIPTGNVLKGETKGVNAPLEIPQDFYNYSVKAFMMLPNLKPISKLSVFTADLDKTPKKVLTQDELKNVMHGYSAMLVDDEGYIDAKRYTTEQENYLKSTGVGAVTSIRNALFDFETSSPAIYLDYKVSGTKIGEIDVFVDGVRQPSTHITSLDDKGTFIYKLDGKKHRIHISLPHSGLLFKNLAVLDGEEITPIANRTKAVFYGDSITQGVGSTNITYSYANTLARSMDYEMINFGASNYVFSPGQVIANPQFVPDVVFVAYGTNDAGRYDESTNRSNITQFIANIKSVYPTQKIYVITPVYCSWNGLLPGMRNMITEICNGVENITVIDGLTLIPNESKYFADTLHPNDEGSAIYAKNLEKAIK